MSNLSEAFTPRPDSHRVAEVLTVGRSCGLRYDPDQTDAELWKRRLSARKRIADAAPTIEATLARSESELLRALAAASAFVALSDGCDDPVSRDEFIRFVDRQGFVPGSSPRVLGEAFDRAAWRLKLAGSALAVLQDNFRPIAGLSLASVVVRTAERVAAADGRMRLSRVQALIVLRSMLLDTADQKERASRSRFSLAANRPA